MSWVLDKIMEEKIIAIIRGVKKDKILDTARAIADGGITCMEIALDHSSVQTVEDTFDGIALLNREMGDRLCIGAGTVLTEEEVVLAAKAGARYIISPDMNQGVIHKTKELGCISIPGALTPSEVVTAYENGADIVKLFPAGVLGTDYIKALRSPLRHIPMSAVGNVTTQNCRRFIEAGCCCVGVGGKLADHGAIEMGEFGTITRYAREYVQNLA